MKNLFTLMLVFICTIAFAQNSNKDLNEKHQQMEKNRLSLDSTMNSLDSSLQRAAKFNDSLTATRPTAYDNLNYTGLARMMEERERKERQRMWLRIGLGIAFLILGIVGIARRKKTKTAE